MRELLRAHRSESEQHAANVEEAFTTLGWDVDDSPCPAIEGLEKEASATVKKTDDALVDSVILQGALEVEHHEIGVYENLIVNAKAAGRDEVARILHRNLESEQDALGKVRTMEAQIAATGTSRQPV